MDTYTVAFIEKPGSVTFTGTRIEFPGSDEEYGHIKFYDGGRFVGSVAAEVVQYIKVTAADANRTTE